MSAKTNYLKLIQHSAGDEGWADDMNNNFDIIDSAIANTLSDQPVINADMSQWQRGDNFVLSYEMKCTADRWAASYKGYVKKVIYDNKPVLQFGRAEGQTELNPCYVGQIIDTPNAVKYRGKTITVNWRVRKGATLDASWINPVLCSSTTVDPTFDGSLIMIGGETLLNYSTIVDDISTDYQIFSLAGTVPDDCKSLSFKIGYMPNGTAGTSDYIEVDKVWINMGSTPLPYVARNDALEKMLCLNYMEVLGGTGAIYMPITEGTTASSHNVTCHLHYTKKRTVPTITVSPPTGLNLYGPEGWVGVQSTSAYTSSTGLQSSGFIVVCQTASFVPGQQIYIRDSDGNTKIFIDAELY